MRHIEDAHETIIDITEGPLQWIRCHICSVIALISNSRELGLVPGKARPRAGKLHKALLHSVNTFTANESPRTVYGPEDHRFETWSWSAQLQLPQLFSIVQYEESVCYMQLIDELTGSVQSIYSNLRFETPKDPF